MEGGGLSQSAAGWACGKARLTIPEAGFIMVEAYDEKEAEK